MRFFLLTCHLMLTVLMIAIILFQRSESSLGLGGGTMGGLMTARGTANLLTRLTGALAALFMALSLLLAYLARTESEKHQILETPPAQVAPQVQPQTSEPQPPLGASRPPSPASVPVNPSPKN